MNHWYFIVPIAVISYVAVLVTGFALGRFYNNLVDGLNKLSGRVKDLEADEALAPGEAVINTTPRTIDRKRRRGELPGSDDEDSAIVTVKSPQKLREEKEARLKADLDEIQGHSSRIE